MPYNQDFEKAMQQQLHGFEVAPSPSDWEAVYTQLHPTKKRRIIWWWVPALVMVAGFGWYIGQEPKGNGQKNAGTQSTLSKSIKQENAEAPSETHSTFTEKITTPPDISAIQDEVEVNRSSSPITQVTVTAEDNTYKTGSAEKADRKLKSEKENGRQPFNQAQQDKTAAVPTYDSIYSISSKEPEHKMLSAQEASAVSPEVPVSEMLPVPTHLEPMVNLDAASPKLTAKKAAWTWGVYAGAGYNQLAEAISNNKAMMDYSGGNSSPNSGSASSRMLSSSSRENGIHLNAGVFVQRKWNRNWQFATGLGVNSSTWSTESTVIKDSILGNGTLYSSNLYAQTNTNYRLLMLELPLEISNRISGKNKNSFWWMAGINNQFVLQQQVETVTQQMGNNYLPTLDRSTSTKGVNKYQPQFRIGLLYDHAGKKTHWQIVPMMNIGMVKTLDHDDFHLNNYQLQGRWFLGR